MKRIALLLPFVLLGCDRVMAIAQSIGQAIVEDPSTEEPPPPSVPAPLPARVENFADVAAEPQRSSLEQAKTYEANGQLVLARFVLEGKALSAEATREETEFLAHICQLQGDEDCVAECAAKLGKKIKVDAGASRASAIASAVAEATEKDSDLSRAQALFQKKKYEAARKLLEPKVLDGVAAPAEVALLRSVCTAQRDRMCIALCDAKLK